MARIVVPVTLYSLDAVRHEMEQRSDHPYHIGTVRKAVREGKLEHLKVDDRTVVVTSEAIDEYLRRHGRFTRLKRKRRERDSR